MNPEDFEIPPANSSTSFCTYVPPTMASSSTAIPDDLNGVPRKPPLNDEKLGTMHIPTKPSSPKLPLPFLYAIFPVTLLLGAVISHLSPIGREPNYFRQKHNLFNVYFVKYAWFWTTFAAGANILRYNNSQRAKAALRYALATLYWVLVTQWFFGPPLMDRAFVWTGGACVVSSEVGAMEGGAKGAAGRIMASATCRLARGRWEGGHDLSGHVFLLTHACLYLISEAWPVVSKQGYSGWTTKGLVGLCVLWWWMFLMTCLYFHTWTEKVG